MTFSPAQLLLAVPFLALLFILIFFRDQRLPLRPPTIVILAITTILSLIVAFLPRHHVPPVLLRLFLGLVLLSTRWSQWHWMTFTAATIVLAASSITAMLFFHSTRVTELLVPCVLALIFAASTISLLVYDIILKYQPPSNAPESTSQGERNPFDIEAAVQLRYSTSPSVSVEVHLLVAQIAMMLTALFEMCSKIAGEVPGLLCTSVVIQILAMVCLWRAFAHFLSR